jgi:hypothetical protein
MRASEFIIEAKPENLGQGMLEKLFATYQQRDANDNTLPEKFENGLQVANLLFQNVGPAYLIWVAKQYNQDPHFFLHDLPTWRADLNKFNRMTRGTQYQIEKDLNKYQDIGQLRSAMKDAMGDHGQVVSKFYQDVTGVMNDFVAKGEAAWLYKSPQYSIYYPKTWESSNICKSVMSTNVCTIMNKGHYDDYSEHGTLMYIVTQDRLYNCYISKDRNRKSSEFADQQNDHKFNLPWMIEHFPALRPLVKKAATPETEPFVQLAIADGPDAQALALNMVKQDPHNIEHIPKNLLTPEICNEAVRIKGEMLAYIPENFRTPEICKRAIENSNIFDNDKGALFGNTVLEFVPKKFRTEELCDIATKRDARALEFVPLDIMTPQMCMNAVKRNPWSIRSVPPELMNEDIIWQALRNPLAIADIPPNMVTYDMARAAVQDNPAAIKGVPKDLLANHIQLAIHAAKNLMATNRHFEMDNYIPTVIQNSKEFMDAMYGGGLENSKPLAEMKPARLSKIISDFGNRIHTRDIVWNLIGDEENNDSGYDEYLGNLSGDYLIMPYDSPWDGEYYDGSPEQDEWLQENNIDVADLDVNWDSIREDNTYINYNDEAAEFLDEYHELMNPDMRQLQQLAGKFELNADREPTVFDLPTLIAMNLREHAHNNYFFEDLAKKVSRYSIVDNGDGEISVVKK